jgi:hypothetical protein
MVLQPVLGVDRGMMHALVWVVSARVTASRFMRGADVVIQPMLGMHRGMVHGGVMVLSREGG